MRVLGLSGSLRAGSYNHRLLLAAGALLPPGARLHIYDGLAGIAPYSEDAQPSSEVQRLRSEMAAADAVLIATPEYNGSIPGQLKNALDWASRPFPHNALRAKPVAVIGASTGLFGAVWAQADLRRVLERTGAEVLEGELPVGQAHDAFGADGQLVDAGLRARLADIVARLSGTAVGAEPRVGAVCGR